MITELGDRIYLSTGYFNKELETIKRNQSKLDNSIAKIKSELKAMNSRLNNAKERISHWGHAIMETTQSAADKKTN